MLRPRYARPLIAAGFATLASLASGVADASWLPDPVTRANPSLQRVGAGELRFLGRPVYDASLWNTAGRFEGFETGRPIALSLWYRRAFSREELLRITSTAWRMMGSTPQARREAWLGNLHSVWTDVAPGDNLTTLVVPGQPTRFYDAHRFVGQVDDPDFGPAFLAIWLDSSSVVGELRASLLGGAEPAVARR